MEQVKSWVLAAGAVVIALLILATLVRAVLGPRFTDRIVAVNVIGTLVIAELVLLSVRLREEFLVDIALVFALLSFLAVVVAARLVAGAAAADRRSETERKGGESTSVIHEICPPGRDWPCSSLACSCFSPLCWACSGSTMCSTGCTPRRWGTPWASSAC